MTTQTIDHHAAQELELYADNTYELYAQKQAIQANVARKIRNGTYDPEKAPKLWQYWIDEAARSYCREFGGSVRTIFPKALRQHVAERVSLVEWSEIVDQVARELAHKIAHTNGDEFAEAVEAGERAALVPGVLRGYVSGLVAKKNTSS